MLGVLAVCAWVGVAITLVFFLLKKTIGLRVSREEEIDGLDVHEHGLISAYADFAPMSLGMVSPEVQETVEGAVPAKSADEAGSCGGNHHRHRRSRIRAAYQQSGHPAAAEPL